MTIYDGRQRTREHAFSCCPSRPPRTQMTHRTSAPLTLLSFSQNLCTLHTLISASIIFPVHVRSVTVGASLARAPGSRTNADYRSVSGTRDHGGSPVIKHASRLPSADLWWMACSAVHCSSRIDGMTDSSGCGAGGSAGRGGSRCEVGAAGVSGGRVLSETLAWRLSLCGGRERGWLVEDAIREAR